MTIAQVIGSIVSQLASGVPLWKISVPASIHTDKSALEFTRDAVFSNKKCLERFNMIDSEEDPVQRLGLAVSGFFNHFNPFSTEKPFNPVLGEYIIEEADGYRIEIEQIRHHPPASAYRLKGPTFMIETPEGFEQAGSKFKFNSLEFEFNSPVKIVTNSGKEIEWINPGFMVEGLIFGKRSAGYSGPFKISDKSGYKFEGKIVKPFKIVGQIIGPDGNVIDTVDGDITKQVLLKSKKQEWFKVIEFEKLETKVPKTALDDPLYTGNVWKEVFVHMRQTPPDFKEADREKGIVEEAQRVRAKENPEKVQSRFGFTCKTIH